MQEQPPHDLHDFMRQISHEMSAEYGRIQRRATEDPGTAGDQGEENWAELLRGWIPRSYQVVTKGRIISQDGRTSPQVDVIVLKDVYPEKLLAKKLYLAAGVAAAFECKTTLRAAHISKAVETSVAVKDLYPVRTGTPYKELHSPILYGLLAHSHVWTSDDATIETAISERWKDADLQYVTHPRQGLDVICVADFGTWTATKLTFLNPNHYDLANNPHLAAIYGPNGSAANYYAKKTVAQDDATGLFTPVGMLIANLSHKLAWENPGLRDLADYYTHVNIGNFGSGAGRMWPSSIYSGEVRARAEGGFLSNGKRWDEWSIFF